MEKPKFTDYLNLTIEELLEFNDDCNDACNRCNPNHPYEIQDRDICLGEVSPKQLFKHWDKCHILSKLGYSECLTIDTYEYFKQYRKYKIMLKAYKIFKKD